MARSSADSGTNAAQIPGHTLRRLQMVGVITVGSVATPRDKNRHIVQMRENERFV